MTKRRPETVDESDESVITIQPDGRIYAFGITRQLVEVLAAIPTGDESTRRHLERLIGHAPPCCPCDRETSPSEETGP